MFEDVRRLNVPCAQTLMMIGFCKNEDCPTSNELLGYQNGDLIRGRSAEIQDHLGACEFCEAEVQFYSHYPQMEPSLETNEPAAIPTPLYELAEALLKNRHSAASLNALLKEQEGVALDLA